MNRRILIVTQKVNMNDPILGFFHRWIIEFAKHCESIVVICLEEGRHELPVNVRVLSLGKEKELKIENGKWKIGSRIRRTLRFYRYIWRERKNYDVVFVHMNPIYVVLGGFVWKILGKRISLWYTHKSVDWKLRIAEKIVNQIFTASKESFRLRSKKVIVTGHGIDTDYFVPNPRSQKNDVTSLVTTGRISAVKNVDMIVEAVKRLGAEGHSVSLNIVGDAVTALDIQYFEKLKSVVAASDSQGMITFTGAVTPYEILQYLQDADVFVNMSTTGSLDKAVLEAMACGLVTVSSNVAFRDILSPYGLYIEETTVEACMQTLARILDSETNLVGSSLREYVLEHHSLVQLVPGLIVRM